MQECKWGKWGNKYSRQGLIGKNLGLGLEEKWKNGIKRLQS